MVSQNVISRSQFVTLKKKMADVIKYNEEKIANLIYIIRGKRVMIDSDLADIYSVETKLLKQAVRRNINRFPEDFMFELTRAEYDSLRSQFVTLKRGQHTKYLPFVFTEHGSLMLSSVLKSETAINASLNIVRAFVKLREMLASNKELAKKIEELEKKYDEQFKVVFVAIRQLMQKPEKSKRKSLGYRYKNKK